MPRPLSFEDLSFDPPVDRQDQNHTKTAILAAKILGVLGATFALAFLDLPILASVGIGVGCAGLAYLATMFFFSYPQNQSSPRQEEGTGSDVAFGRDSEDLEAQADRLLRQEELVRRQAEDLAAKTSRLLGHVEPLRRQASKGSSLEEATARLQGVLESLPENLARLDQRAQEAKAEFEESVKQQRTDLKETLLKKLNSSERSSTTLQIHPDDKVVELLEVEILGIQVEFNSTILCYNSDVLSGTQKTELEEVITKLTGVKSLAEFQKQVAKLKSDIERILS